MDARETQRTTEFETSGIKKIGTRRLRLFQTDRMVCVEILRLSGRCEAAPASIQRPRNGDGATVATIRPQLLQEVLPSTSTFCPRFRSWRPARCPAKLQRSGVPVVGIRQDSMAQPS